MVHFKFDPDDRDRHQFWSRRCHFARSQPSCRARTHPSTPIADFFFFVFYSDACGPADAGRHAGGTALHGMDGFVRATFQRKRGRNQGWGARQMRRKLLDADYFSRQAVNYICSHDVAGSSGIPTVVYSLRNCSCLGSASSGLCSCGRSNPYRGRRCGLLLVRRQKRALALKAIGVLPDLLDLMVVCVDAG